MDTDFLSEYTSWAAPSSGLHLALLSWEFWDGQPTLIVNAGELSESLVRRGIHLGQKLCATFSKKAAEDQGHWVDAAHARTGLPQDTLSFELPLEAEVAKRIWFLCLRSL